MVTRTYNVNALYDVNLTCSKVLIGQAPLSDVKVTSYVLHLRSTFVSPKVSTVSMAPYTLGSNEDQQ